MNCKNCGIGLEGDFCSKCGQKAKVDKITLSNLYNDLVESIVNVNKGFLFTLRELCTRPGITIQEYLDGKRVNHYKPISYLLVWSTVYFLIIEFSNQNTWINDAILGFSNGALDSEKDFILPPLITWLADNYAYTTLLLLPVFSLSSYICFKKYEPNYTEHIVLTSFITGHQAIIYSVFALLNSIFHSEVLESVPFFFSLAYCYWVFSQFFKPGSIARVLLRFILAYILHFIISTLVLAIILGMLDAL